MAGVEGKPHYPRNAVAFSQPTYASAFEMRSHRDLTDHTSTKLRVIYFSIYKPLDPFPTLSSYLETPL